MARIQIRADGGSDQGSTSEDDNSWLESENIFDFRNNSISQQSGCSKERENSQGYLLLF